MFVFKKQDFLPCKLEKFNLAKGVCFNPFVQGPIGPRESDPVFLKIREDYILFFDAALICYCIFNSAQFDL